MGPAQRRARAAYRFAPARPVPHRLVPRAQPRAVRPARRRRLRRAHHRQRRAHGLAGGRDPRPRARRASRDRRPRTRCTPRGCRCAAVAVRALVRQRRLIALDRPVRPEGFATEPGPLPRQRVVILDAARTRGSALRLWRGFGRRRGGGFVHRCRVGHVDANAARVLLPRPHVHAAAAAAETAAADAAYTVAHATPPPSPTLPAPPP